MDIIFLIYYLIKFCITKKYSISNENPLIYKKKTNKTEFCQIWHFRVLEKKLEKNSEKFRLWNSNYLVIKKFPKTQDSS